MGVVKIKVKLKGYDSKVVDSSARLIIDATTRSGARVNGPIPLPTRRKVYCVNASPHIDKRAMEHFEMRVHGRLLVILDPNPKTIDVLTHLQLPVGVGIEIK